MLRFERGKLANGKQQNFLINNILSGNRKKEHLNMNIFNTN